MSLFTRNPFVRPWTRKLPIPDTRPWDTPLLRLCVNDAWLKYVCGAVMALTDPYLWDSTDPDAIKQAGQDANHIASLFTQEATLDTCDCPEPDIPARNFYARVVAVDDSPVLTMDTFIPYWYTSFNQGYITAYKVGPNSEGNAHFYVKGANYPLTVGAGGTTFVKIRSGGTYDAFYFAAIDYTQCDTSFHTDSGYLPYERLISNLKQMEVTVPGVAFVYLRTVGNYTCVDT